MEAYRQVNVENNLPEKFGIEDFELPGPADTAVPSGEVNYKIKVWIDKTGWYPRDYFWIDVTSNSYLSEEELLAFMYHKLEEIAAQYNQSEIPKVQEVTIEGIEE